MVVLTKEYWTEIYYAVQLKADKVDKGEYGEQTRQWAGQLWDILETIGADGEVAAEMGVEPSG